MATNDLPLVLLLNLKNLKYANLKQVVFSYSNILNIVPVEDMTTDQYSKVEGVLIAPATGLLTSNIDGEFMDSFPDLRIISTPSAGVNHINVEEASKRGIKIGFTPEATSDCTADLAFGLLIASARNIVQGDATSKSPNTVSFVSIPFGVKVSGSTIGIVGLGNIGTAVARRAKGFNMKILYCTRTRKDALEKDIGAEYCHQLSDLLQQADFVVLCVPLTPETQYLISAPQLSIMKPSATLINISRGGVVHQEDLVKALKNGQIRGAALDVTSPEPLPRDHPLLTLPNVIITPHNGTVTMTTRLKMLTTAMANLVAGIKGEPLLCQKNKNKMNNFDVQHGV